MRLDEFRRAVRRQFGPRLENMTPANVREFLDSVQSRDVDGPRRFRLDEPEDSYEAILRSFFREVLERPAEEAVVALWLLSLELAFADLGEVISEQLQGLLGSVEAEE